MMVRKKGKEEIFDKENRKRKILKGKRKRKEKRKERR